MPQGPPYGTGPAWAPSWLPPGVPPAPPRIGVPATPALPYAGNVGSAGFVSAATVGPFVVSANVGDALIVAVNHVTTRTVRVIDTAGSLYVPALLELGTGNGFLDLFYCPALLGTNPGVSIVGSGTLGNTRCGWLQIVGASTGWFLDAVNSVPQASANSFVPYVRTSSPNDLLVSVYGGATTLLPSCGALKVFSFSTAINTTTQSYLAFSPGPQALGTVAPGWTAFGSSAGAALTLAIRTGSNAPDHVPVKAGFKPVPPWQPVPVLSPAGPIPAVNPNVTLGLTGQLITSGEGVLALTHAQGLAGGTITSAKGSVALAHAQALLGLRGTFSEGTVTASVGSPDVSRALTGLAATFAQGQISISGATPFVPASSDAGVAGRPKRVLYLIKVDGREVATHSLAEALEILAQVKRLAVIHAQKLAREATERALKSSRPQPLRPALPKISGSRPLTAAVREVRKEIEDIYKSAFRDAEIAMYLEISRRADEDEDITLLLM